MTNSVLLDMPELGHVKQTLGWINMLALQDQKVNSLLVFTARNYERLSLTLN